MVEETENSKSADAPKLVMVLGVHRSGTSAITKGLEVLGVNLGDNLLSPQDDNPKGFFEDKELVDLNEHLLNRLGSCWHSTRPVKSADLLDPSLVTERATARSLLETKFQSANTVGLKDPRLSVLLPFWSSICEEIGADVSFIIPVRNPLEVAQSLQNRNNLSLERGTALWGRYICDSLEGTEGKSRLFVDFRDMLQNPLKQLTRIADAFDLVMPAANDPELINYKDKFLETGLRHQKADTGVLEKSGHTTDIVVGLYEAMSKLAAKPAGDEAAAENKIVRKYIDRFSGIAPLLRELDSSAEREDSAKNAETASKTALAAIGEELQKVQDAHDSACEQRDEAIDRISAITLQMETLQQVRKEDQQYLTESLMTVQRAHDAACQQRDTLEAELAKARAQEEHDQTELKALRAAHDDTCQQRDELKAEVSSLETLKDHEVRTSEHLREALKRAEAEIDTYRKSTSWKLTAPLRGTVRFLRGQERAAEPGPGSQVRGLTPFLLKTLSGKDMKAPRQLPPARPARHVASAGEAPKGAAPWLAVVIHVFYPELLADILKRLKQSAVPMKLYVTTPAEQIAVVQEYLAKDVFPYDLIETDNRGRDVAPFFSAMRWVNQDNPDHVLKLHTKRSTHLDNGDQWRTHLYESLIGLDGPGRAVDMFADAPELGLIGPDGHILSTTDFTGANGASIDHLLCKLGIERETFENAGFVAGTMFYARHDLIKNLSDEIISTGEFEPEQGQIDGTLAHAIERVLGAYAIQQGYMLAALGNSGQQAIPLKKGAYQYL